MTSYLPPGYASEVTTQQQQQQQSQPTQKNTTNVYDTKAEASSKEAAPTMLTDRDKVESEINKKWKQATWGQAFCRGLQVVVAEAMACTTFAVVSIGAGTFGFGPLASAVLDFFLVILVVSKFTRENVGHLDPCVTIMLAAVGKIGLPWFFSIAYILGQTIGWTLGTLFVWALIPGNDSSLLSVPEVGAGWTPGQAFGAEMIGSVLIFSTLLYLVMSDGDLNYYEQTSGKKATSFVLGVASAKAVTNLLLSPISGASCNWFRYFFPAAMASNFDSSNWWLYFIAPALATIFVIGWWFLYNWLDNAAYQHAKEKYSRQKYKRV